MMPPLPSLHGIDGILISEKGQSPVMSQMSHVIYLIILLHFRTTSLSTLSTEYPNKYLPIVSRLLMSKMVI